MNSVTILLILLVGGVIGVLLAVLVDTWYVRRWHSAMTAHNQQLADRLRERSIALGRAEARHAQTQNQFDSLRQEKMGLNYQLVEFAEEKRDWETRLETAVAENDNLRRRVEYLEEQLEVIRAEKQDLLQRTAVAEVEMKHLQADFAEAQQDLAGIEALARDKQALITQLAAAEKGQEVLRGEVARLVEQLADTLALRDSLNRAESRLETAEAQVQTMAGALDHAQTQIKHTGKDQLLIINGIGPAFARRLKDAGIVTLADLARQTPERLREILNLKPSSLADPAAWIAEAQELAPTFNEIL